MASSASIEEEEVEIDKPPKTFGQLEEDSREIPLKPDNNKPSCSTAPAPSSHPNAFAPEDKTLQQIGSAFREAREYEKLAAKEYKHGNIREAHTMMFFSLKKLKLCQDLCKTEQHPYWRTITKEGCDVRFGMKKLEEIVQNKMKYGENNPLYLVADHRLVEGPNRVQNEHPNTKQKEVDSSGIPKHEREVENYFRQKLAADSAKQLSMFQDIVGYKPLILELKSGIIYPRDLLKLTNLEIGQNIKLVSAVLFFGPPGTGKSILSEAIADALNYSILQLSASDIRDPYSGMGTIKMKKVFQVAMESGPCVVFIDEAEALLGERSTTHQESSKEQLTEFLVQVNEVTRHNKENPNKEVFIICATNYPNKIDQAAWRRLKKHYHVPLPSEEDRKEILEHFLKEAKIYPSINEDQWKGIILFTHGFSPADLQVLSDEILMLPRKRLFEAQHFRPEFRFLSESDSAGGSQERAIENLLATYNQVVFGEMEMEEFENLEVWKEFVQQNPEAEIKYVPCLGTDKGSFKANVKEMEISDLALPKLTPWDVLSAAEKQLPSLNLGEDGPVKMNFEFALTSGVSVGAKTGISNEERHNLDDILDRAAVKAGFFNYGADYLGGENSSKASGNGADLLLHKEDQPLSAKYDEKVGRFVFE